MNGASTVGMADAQMLLGALAALAVAGVAAGSLYARQYFAGRKQASEDSAQEEPRRDLRRKRGCSTFSPCHAAVVLCLRAHKLLDVVVHVPALVQVACIVRTLQGLPCNAACSAGSSGNIYRSYASSPASYACRIAPAALLGIPEEQQRKAGDERD